MPNLNRVMLMGNLTRDPELRYTPSNNAVCNLGLAVNRRWRNQQGENQEETTFVDCEAWGRTAEVLNQYLRKGRPVYLEGRLKLDQWQDKEGGNRSKLKVVVETFQFIDSRESGSGPAPGSGGGGSAGHEDSSYGGASRGGGRGSASGGPGGSAPGGASGGASGGGGRAPARTASQEPEPDAHPTIDDDDIPF